ncbi:MAG: outer membrane protein assembly factor BamB family protein [Planctomycetota bacterium]
MDGSDNPADLKRRVCCFDLRNGTPAWTQTIQSDGHEREYTGFIRKHGYASGSPATDGERVYAYLGTAGVYAFTMDGDMVWHVPTGTYLAGFGSGSSCILHDNLLFVNAYSEGKKRIALDKSNGELVWEVGSLQHEWSTPILVTSESGRRELVFSKQRWVLGLNPMTGGELWKCAGVLEFGVIPSPIAHDGIVYAIGGRGTSGVAIRAGGTGDVSDSRLLWRTKGTSHVPSPAYYEGSLWWIREGAGIVCCVDAATGEVRYQERLSPRPDAIYASPVVADGKVYLVSRTKGTYVLAAKPQFELLAHNTLEDESVFNASLAVVGGSLILRSDTKLYCLAETSRSRLQRQRPPR